MKIELESFSVPLEHASKANFSVLLNSSALLFESSSLSPIEYVSSSYTSCNVLLLVLSKVVSFAADCNQTNHGLTCYMNRPVAYEQPILFISFFISLKFSNRILLITPLTTWSSKEY